MRKRLASILALVILGIAVSASALSGGAQPNGNVCFDEDTGYMYKCN